MTRSDKCALLCLTLAMLASPPILGALHERPRRPHSTPVALAAAPTATPLRSPTPRPTLGPSPGPTATVFVMAPWPTPNPWHSQPPAEVVERQIAAHNSRQKR